MKELIVRNDPKSPVSEAYRTIRTNLQFANVDQEMRVILVTSSVPSEGKTTTLINLAVTLADTGSKVLVMDCDMRKPRVHKALRITNHLGVSELLLHGEGLEENPIRPLFDNVDVLTAGKPPANPSELLCSKAMKDLMQKLRGEYDYILMDTPPVLPVTDAQILSSIVDGVILVCEAAKTDQRIVKQAHALLEKVDAKIIGVVLNKLPIKGEKYYQYYYYYGKDSEGAR